MAVCRLYRYIRIYNFTDFRFHTQKVVTLLLLPDSKGWVQFLTKILFKKVRLEIGCCIFGVEEIFFCWMNRFFFRKRPGGACRLCCEGPAEAEVQASAALKDILLADVEDGDDGSNRAR